MRSPIKWVGGKSKLSKAIVALIPEHTCYVEVFETARGMGAFSEATPS